MKKYLIIKAFLTLLLGLLIVFGGCNKDKLVGEYYLSDEMKQTVPFDGSETITFIDGEDTILLSIGERNSYIHTTYISQTEYTYWEEDATEFKTEIGDFKIYLVLLNNQNANDQGGLVFEWTERKNNIIENTGVFNFNVPLNKQTLLPGQWLLNEIVIHDVKYTNVYCDSIRHVSGYTWPNEPETIYYTKEAGIVKINFTRGNTWELLKIDYN